MVGSFLSRRNFAYYLSDKFFGPILTARWRANVIHAPIVSDVSVEMPVDKDSGETGEGVARVQVNLSDMLQESSIKASEDNRYGDPLRLVSEQTIHLLRLWFPNGDEAGDLGDLGAPATQPFVLSLQMFDQLPANMQQTLKPDMEKFLFALLLPLYVPVLERFAIKEISGFTSSAMRALVVRWNLKTPLDSSTSQPTGGVLTAV